MVQQMNDIQRMLVKDTIQDADPRPEDIEDCVELVIREKILSQTKVRTFRVELRQVCKEALDARGARATRGAEPPSPPASGISPSSSADLIPGTLQADGALLAAARSNQDTPETVYLYNNGDFDIANARFTNAECSYIQEKRAKKLGFQCDNETVQIEWKDPNVPRDGDHTVRETVFVLVSNEQASSVKMNVDILFGQHYNKEPDVQLQAVRATVNLQSAPSPLEVQPDDSCAGSVAEAAMPSTQALKAAPPQLECTLLLLGPNQERRVAKLYTAVGCEATPQSGAHGVPA